MSEPVPEFDRNIDRFTIRDTKSWFACKRFASSRDERLDDQWLLIHVLDKFTIVPDNAMVIYYSVVTIYFIDMIALLILSFHLCVCLSIFSFSSSASPSTIINFDIDIGTGVGIVSPSSSHRRRCCRCYCCRCHRWWDLESHSSKFF